jgi:hypothetical protein
MKRYAVLSLLAAGLTLLSVANSNAWSVATNVPATAITAVPFAINAPGNYYLATDLVFTGNVGAAIIINASQVTLDLNGHTLSTNVSTAFNIGVFVFNRVDVTIKEGDIDGFGYAGVYFAPNSTDVNAKNVVDDVRFNNDEIGVLSVSGTSNWVKNCIIDGGDVGIWFLADSGSRASNNILENQKKTELIGMGVALLSTGSLGAYFDNNLVYNVNTVGQMLSTTDKFRFETFVGTPTPIHAGGTDQMATSI